VVLRITLLSWSETVLEIKHLTSWNSWSCSSINVSNQCLGLIAQPVLVFKQSVQSTIRPDWRTCLVIMLKDKSYQLGLLSSKHNILSGWIQQIPPFWWWQTNWPYWPLLRNQQAIQSLKHEREVIFKMSTIPSDRLKEHGQINLPPFGIIEKNMLRSRKLGCLQPPPLG